MATNTGGGTTASLSNTPQAQDDSFILPEDYNSVKWLDVMANDLGGNAKILWSLDDSATDAAGATDLIASDIGKVEATTGDTSLNGAKIWIQDGKVAYDAATLSGSFRAQLQALAVGERLTDSFTYAIRLANGTLSWGTATVVYTGSNDGPDISLVTTDSASKTLAETDSVLSTSGTLTVVDPDTSDDVAMSITGFSKSGNAGTLTDLQLKSMFGITEATLAANVGDSHNLHWAFGSSPQTFDYLADGESLTLTYTVTANDGHGGTDTQSVTITINGTNDGPQLAPGGSLSGGVEEESGTYLTSGSFGFTDLDSSDHHSVSVTAGGSGYLGTLTPTVSDDSTGDGAGTIGWTFSVDNAALQFLGEQETRTQIYTVMVSDGHGGTVSQTITITLTGDEDPIVVTSAPQAQSISEDGASVGGTIAFTDVDLSDGHSASASAHAGNATALGSFSIDPSVTEAANAADGSIGWSYTVDNSAAQYLAQGETAVEKYDVTFNDGHGSVVTETVTVTITGSNDGPDIRAVADDSAGHGVNETDAGVSASGTLTVTDPDTSDTVDTSVTHLAISGSHPGLTSADLLAMFHITAGADDLAADTGDSHNLGWSFDSSGQAFDYLAVNETLTLTYTLTSTDVHGVTDTQDVTIVITGTNDAPAAHAVAADAGEDGPAISASADFTDADVTDSHSFSIDTTGTLGSVTNNHDGTFGYDPNGAFESLAAGETATDSFAYTVDDGHGGTSTETVTVTIHGGNDGPQVIAGGSLQDGVTEDSGDYLAGGSFTFTDVDGSDTHSVSVAPNGAGYLGTLTPTVSDDSTGDGTGTIDWNFAVDNDDLQFLGENEILTQTYTVTVSDGHAGGTTTETVTVTLTGANDPVVIVDGGTVSGGIGEDGGVYTADGSYDFTDVDLSDVHDFSIAPDDADYLGTLTPTFGDSTGDGAGSVSWSFSVDNADLQFLGENETLTQTYTTSVSDGHGGFDTQVITVSLTGANDPVIVTSDPQSEEISEDGTSVGGTIAFSDVDLVDGHTASAAPAAGNATSLGSFSIDASITEASGAADGTIGWSYAVDNDAAQYLAAGESVTEHYDVTISDGHGGDVTETVEVTITGSNDGPDITAIVGDSGGHDFDETDVGLSTTGTLTVTDPDTSDTVDTAVSNLVVSGNQGALTDGDLAAMFHITSGASNLAADSGDAHNLGWSFDSAGEAFDFLAEGQTLTLTYTLTSSDGTASDSQDVTITITGTNDAPALTASVTEHTYTDTANDDSFGVTGGMLSTVDPDTGDSATYSVDGGVGDNSQSGFDTAAASDYGTLYLNSATGAYEFVPDDGAIEALKSDDSVSFTLNVSDNSNATDGETLTINLHGANDRPDAPATNSVTTDEDTASAAVAIGASDRDAGDHLTYSIKPGEGPSMGGVSFDQGAGTFTYTPDANANGSDSFTVVVTDADGLSTEQVVSVTVNPVNDAPEAANDGYVTDEDTPLVVSVGDGVLGNDSDIEGDSLGATLVTGPAHGSLALNADGSFTYTPEADYNGNDSFTYKANDGSVDSNVATVNLFINAVNDAPVSSNGSGTIDEDGSLSAQLPAATDVDGPQLGYLLSTQAEHGTATVNPDGSFTYTPDANFNGDDFFGFTVTDGLTTNSYFYDVTVNAVNDAPEASDDVATTNEDTPLTLSSGDLLGNDSDVDIATNGQTLNIGSVSDGAHGTVVLNGDGSVTYTPDADFNGTDTITYTVSDGHGGADTASVVITVNPVNDAPVAQDDVVSTAEDTAVTFDVRTNDSDVDGDSLAVTHINGTAISVGNPVAITGGSVSLESDGQLTFSPDANFNGTPSFAYTVSDGHGGSDTATVDLTVTAVNDAPTGLDDSYSINEDTSLVVGAPGVLANDSDVEGDALASVLVSGPAHGGLALNADGSFTYTPNANYNGSDSFSYVPNDGSANGSPVTVNLTIIPVNDAPMSAAGSGSTYEDTALVGSLPAASDVDGDSVAFALAGQASHGAAAVNADGTFSYTPAQDFNGSDSFSFTVSDGHGGSNTYTYAVTVNPVNDAPVALGDSYTTAEDTALVVTAPGVLGNDSDVDGNALTSALVSGPAHGTLSLNADGSFTYTPTGDYNGSDSFTYKANDGSADSAPVTVNLTVTAVNDAPDIRIGSGDTGSVTLTETNAPLSAGGTLTVTDVDTPDTISVSNVALYNATGSQGTITDQQLLAMFTVAPMSGVAANVGDSGNLAWSFNSTPEAFNYLNAGQSLTLEFAVEVSDGHGGQDTQHVSVIINGTADAPVIGGVDIGSVTEDDAAHTIASGALTISDPDAGQSSFVAQSATGTYGSFAIDASGNWSYTLNNADPDTAALNTGQNPIETFTVHSADGTAHDVKVTVNGHTDFIGITLPPTFTGTGDPNDFDNLGGAPAGSAVNFTGGGGTDVVDGSNSVDTLNGGGGDDTLYGHGGDDNINGGNGADTHLYGQAGNDLIYGANGSDTIYGGSGNDTIYGNEPPPPNETGDTGDTIFGGSGGDFIYGQGGNDAICGGYGADILSGGGGSDSFVYLDVKDTNDTITDFALGDTINLNALDADGVLSGNQNFAFGGTTATAHGVWYAQVGGDTLVYVDTDGNSSTAELAITLTGSHALTSSDFIL